MRISLIPRECFTSFASSSVVLSEVGLGRMVVGLEKSVDGGKQGRGRAMTEGTVGVRRERSVCLSDVEFDDEGNANTILP